jgi:plasmid maintenance system antidote protein VapI
VKTLRNGNPAKVKFGERVYRAMADKGWRQSDLARAAGITRDHISRYITGRSFPTESSLKSLAQALDTTPEELLPQRVHASYSRATHVPKVFAPFTMHVDQSDPGVAWITVSRLVTVETAIEVANLLHSDSTSTRAG